MFFWFRHFLLLLLVVVGPVATALWLDANTEVERARAAGMRDAKRAAGALSAQVTLTVRHHVDDALAAAHDLEDAKVFSELSRSKARVEAVLEVANARLDAARPPGGFAWLVDAEGSVVAGMSGQPDGADSETPARSIAGHPLFTQTQLGFAVDMLWRKGDPLIWGAASPLVADGRAQGAVVVGWPVDQAFVSRLARKLDVGLTLVEGERVAFSSLDKSTATDLVRSALGSTDPVVAGALSEPLPSPVAGLPLFLGPRAEGLAFSSFGVSGPGRELTWVVSVPAASALQAVALRQVNLLGGGLALAMVVILFTVTTHRTYVRPLAKISDHLSDIQLGRGELELSERRVSRPFRRIVRLINMTVQKLPTRLGTGATLAGSTRVPGARASAMSNASATAPAPTAARRPDVPADDGAPAVHPATEDVGLPNDLLLPATAVPKGDDDALEEIAQAIAALEPSSSAEPEPSGPLPAKRSAAEIRGGQPKQNVSPFEESVADLSAESPSRDLRSGDEFHEVSQFTLHPRVRGQTSVRGGGSLDLGQSAGITDNREKRTGMDSTAVSPVQEELLAQSAREDATGQHDPQKNQDMTVVASVDPKLLSQTVTNSDDPQVEGAQRAGADRNTGDPSRSGLEDVDWNHFKEVYEDFLALRRKCGEQTQDLAFDRFLAKLKKNRSKLIEKYNCKTVRFQVYEKEGKAALKATPVRAR